MSQLTLTTQTMDLSPLRRRGDKASERNRINTLEEWCIANNYNWLQIDLGEYRDYLVIERGMRPTSVVAHLSTIRKRYRDLSRDNKFRDWVYEHTPAEAGVLERKAFADELITRLINMADPQHSNTVVTKKQDIGDHHKVWLTPDQCEKAIYQIGLGKDTLHAARDRAITALFLTTGLRRNELAKLRRIDLFRTMKGHDALEVRTGKGDKQRMVLYGDLVWGRDDYVVPWLNAAEITEDNAIVFRGFYRGYNTIRRTAMDPATVWRIYDGFRIDNTVDFTTHDLRRTYARLLYNSGMQPEAVQKQMGHASLSVTFDYIGDINVDLRIPNVGVK